MADVKITARKNGLTEMGQQSGRAFARKRRRGVESRGWIGNPPPLFAKQDGTRTSSAHTPEYRRIFDGGDDLHGAAAIRAVFDVDIEDPLQSARPTHARTRSVRVLGMIGGGLLAWFALGGGRWRHADDPCGELARKLFSLFDEYQSKENAKHTLRAMKENARQGY